MQATRLRWLGLILSCAALAVACTGPTAPTDSAAAVADKSGFVIRVLSNRSDLISGGDALVEVVLGGADPSKVSVKLNGKDVTSQFAQRANGRYMGVVAGLALGDNTLTVHAAGGKAQSITITNHPNGGPVLAGPQLQPWTCRDGGDAQCNKPATYSYMYKSTDPTKSGLQPYDPANPATDVASTKTDNGTTVPFIVRVETGYQDRDQYKIAVLFQPGQDWSAWAPQPQFNHKLVITHGVSCGVDYQSGSAPSVTSYNPADVTGSGAVPSQLAADAVAYALGAGFAVMSTALDYSGHNCNVALQAESLIMAKELLVEKYGELRYTIGTGCSGGSLAQQWIANAYPGIYQGILPTCSFPDAWGTATQFADYHLLLAYFLHPNNWGTGVTWTEDQMARVMGHVSIVNSEVSDNAQFHVAVPTDACKGVTAEQRYNPTTNPGGVRCDVQDAAINLFAPRVPDEWGPQEKAIGHGFAGFPVDNVGVQYGLQALQQGFITPAQFVDLNVKIGGLDIDTNPVPARTPASTPALANAYRTGLINETNNLDRTAIIDCRGPDPGAFHDSYRAFTVRARLDREHGSHANQLIWEGPAAIIGDTKCSLQSLQAMDGWLAAVEKDTSTKPLPQKLVDDKPGDLLDACFDGNGQKLADGLCPGPTNPTNPDDPSNVVVPVYGTPRMVAGDAITTDANKCQLKSFNAADLGPVAPLFMADQLAALQTLFANGVCDYSKPGVSQQGTIPWLTYQDATGAVIYGGTPLPPAPANSGSGWAGPAFQ